MHGSFRIGRGSVLGPLESAVMEIVWDRGGEVTVGDVHDALAAGGRDLAYSTVKAILTNLATKGHLRKRAEGRNNLFAPALSRAAFRKRVIGAVLASLTQTDRNPLIAQFVDVVGTDEAALDAMEALIAQKRAGLRDDA